MYRSHRSTRYEYATDCIDEVEELQCMTCKFAEPIPDISYMCDAQLDILLEQPVDFMTEEANGKVVCHRYEAAT